MKEFENKVIVLSGSASGIGASTVKLFISEGAKVIGVDLASSEKTAEEVKHELGSFDSIEGDVSKEATWESVAKLAEKKGGADVLINIAGYSMLEDNAETLSVELWDKLMDVNLKGSWLSAKHLLPQLKQKERAAIVNTSSATGIIGVPNHAAYSMSKGGLNALTRQLAVDYAKYNVRVNAIAPGPVRTPMMSTNTKEAMAEIVNAVPLKRIAEPEEIAAILRFLASKAASSITGVILPVEGGMSIAM
ncbi:SDR family NAD(P)-dependent oxidoreductase [Flammeovirga sp. SJP92]|uniref:SDR family NAD(P)-dependent oxidoreductase n=1 Tax=Flammeovirga sp. SJP92 TaxID=1775430 RepID=UPI00078950DA|nr:SDR family oxidoreductase [Flammeovirga sp. SJP92]KXX71825.1 hypothetical protein AVL50_03305 [Flammeovirga sp. SJP92]